MTISKRNIVFAYHNLHDRILTADDDRSLFRNSTSVTDFGAQLFALGRTVKFAARDGVLVKKNLFFGGTCVHLTFDDGYKNNLRAARMMFESFGAAPMTVFLTTNLVGSDRSLWTAELALLMLKGTFITDTVEFRGTHYKVGSIHDRLASHDAIRHKLKKMNAAERRRHCDRIFMQAPDGEIERLLNDFPEFRMLGLDDIEQMRSMGVRFQPHGHNHELLHSGQDPDVIRREIADSKKFIETNIGQACSHFAFPNGDYCDAAIAAVKANGFSGAYSMRAGFPSTLENNFEIQRLTPNSKLHKFRRQLRGKFD